MRQTASRTQPGIGSAGSLACVLSVGSFASFGSLLSGLSFWSVRAWRPQPKAQG